MQVMAGDADVDSETAGQGIHPLGIDRSGGPGGAGVGQSPEARNIGEIEPISRRQHTRCRPIHRILKPLSNNVRVIGPSIPISIGQPSHNFALPRQNAQVGGKGIGQEGAPVGHAPKRHVGQEPVGFLSDVEDADGPTVRFGQIGLSLAIKRKRHAVAQLGFRSPDIEPESGAELKPLTSLGRLGPGRRGSPVLGQEDSGKA